VQLFAELAKDLSSEEASHDRGLMWEYIKPDMDIEKIKELVKNGRDLSKKLRKIRLSNSEIKPDEIEEEALAGMGLERTIARFDRIAFFLLTDEEELRMKPPEWLWSMVNKYWCRLSNWIQYRQSCTGDEDYFLRGYAIYFKKLADKAPRDGTSYGNNHD